MLTIRRYEDGDREDVWALHNLALKRIGAHAGNGEWDEDLHVVEERYLKKGGEFVVGIVDCGGKERIVAMGGVKRMDAKRGGVTRMRVHPDYQKRGFGRQILRHLEGWAKEQGIERLMLETTVQQVGAQRLYEAEGYEMHGRTTYWGFEVMLYDKVIGGEAAGKAG